MKGDLPDSGTPPTVPWAAESNRFTTLGRGGRNKECDHHGPSVPEESLS
jgi:hypothetical protein